MELLDPEKQFADDKERFEFCKSHGVQVIRDKKRPTGCRRKELAAEGII